MSTKAKSSTPASATFVHQVHPGHLLGPFVLGTSLWETLHLIEASRSLFPTDDYIYSSTHAVQHPSYIRLSSTGISLHFDGPQQLLRLIEVDDFTKIALEYDGHQVARRGTRPSYRHVTNLFGPTFPGEYIPPPAHTPHNSAEPTGAYILSYPGLALKFPVDASRWVRSPSKRDSSTLLSSSATDPAQTLAIFKGPSYPEVRKLIYTPNELTSSLLNSLRTQPKPYRYDPYDDFLLARIYGAGRVDLVTRAGQALHIVLSQTTPQDLVADLGPPDAIYRKLDRRLAIHQHGVSGESDRASPLPPSGTTSRPGAVDPKSDTNSTEAGKSYEHFYNYFRHGITFLISHPVTSSPPFPCPSSKPDFTSPAPRSFTYLTATKMLIHSNVPGSPNFHHFRRLRWRIEVDDAAKTDTALTSEMRWASPKDPSDSSSDAESDDASSLVSRLCSLWAPYYAAAGLSETEIRQQQRSMTLDRTAAEWGYASGVAGLEGSIEVLGEWEDESGVVAAEDLEDESNTSDSIDSEGEDSEDDEHDAASQAPGPAAAAAAAQAHPHSQNPEPRNAAKKSNAHAQSAKFLAGQAVGSVSGTGVNTVPAGSTISHDSHSKEKESSTGQGMRQKNGKREDTVPPMSSTTELFGFPGMVFEVLQDGHVACLQIF